MDLIQFIFALIKGNVPVTPSSLEDLEIEANAWKKNLGPVEQEPRTIKGKLIKVERNWAFRLFLCLIYIPINRSFKSSSLDELDDPFELHPDEL